MAKLRLEIVTAEREVFADDVDMVVAPGGEGELGILLDHAPLLTTLQPGVLRLKKDGDETLLAVSGANHAGSELTGIAFNPAGDRLYFSSQRANALKGEVYEVSGPFRTKRRA